MVDYSKWDNFTDDEDEEPSPPRPQVHRLTGDSTFRSGNVTITPSSSSQIHEIKEEKKEEKEKGEEEEEGERELKERMENGGKTERLLWRQTPFEVTISVFVPHHIKPDDIGFCISDEHMRIRIEGKPIIDDEFAFPVSLPEQEDPEFMWELKNIDKIRIIEITIPKKKLMNGIVVWWDRVFKSDPKIDPSKIKGRNSKKSKEFQESWKEAHRMFAEKVREREPIEIEIEKQEEED